MKKVQILNRLAEMTGMAALPLRDRRTLNDLDITDLGSPDTVRFNVLTFVVNEEYERAVHYLKDYLERDSDYPN